MSELRLLHALKLYKAKWLEELGKAISTDENAQIDEIITALVPRAGTASGQRSAFKVVALHLANLVDSTLESSKDVAIRDEARALSGLPLIPALAPKEAKDTVPLTVPKEDEARLLDVEIVAIYW